MMWVIEFARIGVWVQSITAGDFSCINAGTVVVDVQGRSVHQR